MKTLHKKLLPMLVLLCLACLFCVQALAEPTGAEMNSVRVFENGEHVATYPAIGYKYMNQSFVATVGLQVEDGMELRFITDDNADGYPLETETIVTANEYLSLVYTKEKSINDSGFLKICPASKGQKVGVLYWSKTKRGLDYYETTISWKGDNMLELEQGIDTSEVYEPAVVLDLESNQSPGLVFGGGIVLDLYTTLYGEDGDSDSSSQPETAPSLPSTIQSGDEGDSGPAPTAAPLKRNESKNSKEKGFMNAFEENLMLAGICGFLLIVIIVLVVVMIARKKPAQYNNFQDYNTNYGPQNNNGYAPQNNNGMENIGYSETVLSDDAPGGPAVGNQLLVARGGYMDGRIYPLNGYEVTFGRAANCTIRFPENTKGVSRTHAKLYSRNGQLMLEDQNSSNGTYVQRIGKLSPMVPVALVPGDIIYIGERSNAFVYQV